MSRTGNSWFGRGVGGRKLNLTVQPQLRHGAAPGRAPLLGCSLSRPSEQGLTADMPNSDIIGLPQSGLLQAGTSCRPPASSCAPSRIVIPSFLEGHFTMISRMLLRALPVFQARFISPLPIALAIAVTIMFMLVGSTRAMAAPDAVQVMLTQQKVVKDKDGKELRIDAANVLPGDVVEYRAVYRNVSKAPVTGLLADLPIPEGLAYVDGSATPVAGLQGTAAKAPAASSYSALPLMRTGSDGKMIRLPLADYRGLRWTVGRLAPGAQFVVRARAKVIAPEPIAPAARKNAPQAPPAGARP